MILHKPWKPKEIIVNKKVKNDLVAKHILQACPNVPFKYVSSGSPEAIKMASVILSQAGNTMLDTILAGKQVMYIGPATDTVDEFTMPDDRLLCPHFDRLKLASNGCFYKCDWCYLKLTYRAAFPYINVKAQYDVIKKKLQQRLDHTEDPVMFNSGELADSLAMEHLTRAGREFIPWFSKTKNGYLFMLTKSANVDDILELQHNGHTIIAWSINNAEVSRKFEIGAPPLHERLEAARQVQEAGYRLRLRLDPIVPIEGWQEAYADTVKQIFQTVQPERMTLGTLRFEEGFHKMRNSILTTGGALRDFMQDMQPMFSPKMFPGAKRPKSGKYSFSVEQRTEIFQFVINEIRKYSDCPVALCKESAELWDNLGLDRSRCRCVCQYEYANLSNR